jgi:hypothetical protein
VDPAASLSTVLGRKRVLDAAAHDGRRAIALQDGVVVGVGAFELLYGPRAEFAVALRDVADHCLALELVVSLARAAEAFDVRTLRAEVGADQLPLAEAIPGGSVIAGGLQLDRLTAVEAVDAAHPPCCEAADRPLVRIVV